MIPAPAAQSPVILLIGHGSRHGPGNDAVRRFAEHTQARHPQRQLLTCFVELAEPTLADGLAQAAQAARAANPTAPKVVAVPLIINAAGHVKMEIPEAVAAAQADYPDVTFHLAVDLLGSELGWSFRASHEALVNSAAQWSTANRCFCGKALTVKLTGGPIMPVAALGCRYLPTSPGGRSHLRRFPTQRSSLVIAPFCGLPEHRHQQRLPPLLSTGSSGMCHPSASTYSAFRSASAATAAPRHRPLPQLFLKPWPATKSPCLIWLVPNRLW